MFDVGFWEVALLAVIALIVLGPERLPVVARTAGRFVGRVRSYAQGLTQELEREVDIDGFRREVDQARNSVESGARNAVDDIESDTRRTVDDVESVAADIENDHNRADGAARAQSGQEPDQDSEGRQHSLPVDDVAEAAQVEDDSGEDYAAESEMRSAADDLAEYGEDEPFSVERARAERAQRASESQH